MTTTATRCPDWCESKEHNGTDLDCDGHDGPNWPSIDSMHGGGYHSVQIAAGYDVEYGVTVTLEAQNLFLSPEQARQAGLALLSAASWAKDHAAVTS